MKLHTVFLKGGMHVLPLSKQQFEGRGLQAIYRESVGRSIFDLKSVISDPLHLVVYFAKDPLFITASFIWLIVFVELGKLAKRIPILGPLIPALGSDMKSLDAIGKELGIPVHRGIDARIEEIIDHYFPINYLPYIVYYAIGRLLPPAAYLSAFITILALHFFLVVMFSVDFRNRKMADGAVALAEKEGHETVAMYTGALHVWGIAGLLRSKGVVVERLRDELAPGPVGRVKLAAAAAIDFATDVLARIIFFTTEPLNWFLRR